MVIQRAPRARIAPFCCDRNEARRPAGVSGRPLHASSAAGPVQRAVCAPVVRRCQRWRYTAAAAAGRRLAAAPVGSLSHHLSASPDGAGAHGGRAVSSAASAPLIRVLDRGGTSHLARAAPQKPPTRASDDTRRQRRRPGGPRRDRDAMETTHGAGGGGESSAEPTRRNSRRRRDGKTGQPAVQSARPSGIDPTESKVNQCRKRQSTSRQTTTSRLSCAHS